MDLILSHRSVSRVPDLSGSAWRPSETCHCLYAALLLSMSQYPVPPPSYGNYGKGSQEPEATPLAETSRRSESDPLLASGSFVGGSVSDQPEGNDVPDDFKAGIPISQHSAKSYDSLVWYDGVRQRAPDPEGLYSQSLHYFDLPDRKRHFRNF